MFRALLSVGRVRRFAPYLVALSAISSFQSIAAITVYAGYDYATNEFSPHPQSDAAAAAFDAATLGTGQRRLIDFESSPLGAFTTFSVVPGVVITGSYPSGGSPSSIQNSSADPGNARRAYNNTVGGTNFNQMYAGIQTIDFATPIIGFGLYISGLQNEATITFNDGTNQLLSYAALLQPSWNGGQTFVGFVTNGTPFSRVTLSVANALGVADDVGIDDVRYVSAVPEAETITLFGSGLVLVIAALRRNRHHSGQ